MNRLQELNSKLLERVKEMEENKTIEKMQAETNRIYENEIKG
jgi:hypothetical protein